MAKRTKSLHHAQHNSKVSKHINVTSDFSDWVITTSFYSALHYVSFKLFPLKIYDDSGNKLTIKTFEDYCLYQKHQLGDKTSKHKLLLNLVSENYPEIYGQYNWLHDTCHSARYKDYELTKELSDAALKKLEAIKVKCED